MTRKEQEMPDNKYSLEDILAEYDNKKSAAKTSSANKDTAPPSLEPKPDIKASEPVSNPVSEPIKTPLNTEPEPEKIPKPVLEKETATENIPNAKPESSSVRMQSNPSIKQKTEQYRFLFKQLVKRDFKGRYKRAVLGVLWSMLSPMFNFAAQAIIFSVLFKRGAHYISYLIVGNVVFHFFTDSANSGMFSMVGNGGILSKINVPKSIFLLSKSVSCLLNFLLTMIIMFIITVIDGIPMRPICAAVIIPMTMMSVFNLGVGYALSTWFVFFKDTQYLFSIFTQVLMYFSAIFYRIDSFADNVRVLFYLNPVYCYITYFRMIVIDGVMPGYKLNVACALYAVIMLFTGMAIFKKNDHKFVFYF